MKENNKQNIMHDKQWMKTIMQAASQQPSENLSYRIMHQIETEQALMRSTPHKQKVSSDKIIDLRVFGWMYAIIILAAGYFFFMGGKEAVFSQQFLWMCVCIVSIFSFCLLIITLDNYLRHKRKNTTSPSQ